MALLDRFRRKKDGPPPRLLPIAQPPRPIFTEEAATAENVKAKMDLVLSRMDSLRTEQEAFNERLINMERMIKEIYSLAKS